MTLVKFNPASTYGRENNMVSFDRIFNDFFNYNFDQESNVATRPMANIKDTESHIILEIAAPGFEKENFDISIENKVLKVSISKEEEEADDKLIRSEFNFNGFSRNFKIGNSLNTDKVDASYSQGILRIVLEKKEEEKVKTARQIEVK